MTKKSVIYRPILTKRKKNVIVKLTIREFRNHFTKYRKLVEQDYIIVVLNNKTPILVVSKYEYGILDAIRKENK